MGRNMSPNGQLEEERVNCMSISIEELNTLDDFNRYEKFESKIIAHLKRHPHPDIQRCGEILEQIDRQQDIHVDNLRESERKQIRGHGGNLEILEEVERIEVTSAGGSKNPRNPYRKNTQTLF